MSPFDESQTARAAWAGQPDEAGVARVSPGEGRWRPVAPPTAGAVIPGVRKIGVLRANAVGDFIFALPAFEALRAAYPEAEIVLLGRAWHRDFLAGRPGPIDRVLVVPEGGIGDQPGVVAAPSDMAAFYAAAHAERFDLALQIHGGGRNSNPVLRRLGARFTAGLRTPDAPPLDRWVPYLYWQSEVLRYLEVASLVGAPPVTLEPRLCVTEADVHESRATVPATTTPLVALHPGASDPRRRWPVEKFARVGDALAAAGARVVVTGIAAERDLVDRVVGAMQAEALNLCGRLSLNGLAGLLARCAVLVSNDTGPLHVAMAVGAATVPIYWCGNLINAGPFTRLRHRPALAWRLTCPICGTDTIYDQCSHDASFVADVPTEEVRDAALELLATNQTTSPADAPPPSEKRLGGRRT